MQIGVAIRDHSVITAGSGVAIGLPQNFGIVPSAQASALPATPGRNAIICGSCSLATQAQVNAHIEAGRPAFAVDVRKLLSGQDQVGPALAWFATQAPDSTPLFYSTADAGSVQSLQQEFGVDRSGKLIEDTLAAIATGVLAQGCAQSDRGRRRNLRRGGSGARNHSTADRTTNRSGCAVVRLHNECGTRPDLAPGAEVRKLWRCRFFQQGLVDSLEAVQKATLRAGLSSRRPHFSGVSVARSSDIPTITAGLQHSAILRYILAGQAPAARELVAMQQQEHAKSAKHRAF